MKKNNYKTHLKLKNGDRQKFLILMLNGFKKDNNK